MRLNTRKIQNFHNGFANVVYIRRPKSQKFKFNFKKTFVRNDLFPNCATFEISSKSFKYVKRSTSGINGLDQDFQKLKKNLNLKFKFFRFFIDIKKILGLNNNLLRLHVMTSPNSNFFTLTQHFIVIRFLS